MTTRILLLLGLLVSLLAGTASAASPRITDATAKRHIRKELGTGPWRIMLRAGKPSANIKGFSAINRSKQIRQGAVDMLRRTGKQRVVVFDTGGGSGDGSSGGGSGS